jgi:hypothetical protein
MSTHRNPRQRLSKPKVRNNPGGRETPTNYYRQMLHVRGDEEHPVDLAVERRLDRRAPEELARREREVMASLDKTLVLELESRRSDIRNDREEAFFNVGYEHGIADGLARARRGSLRLSKEVQQFVAETRERMVQLEAPGQAALGLLECLWAALARLQAGEA